VVYVAEKDSENKILESVLGTSANSERKGNRHELTLMVILLVWHSIYIVVYNDRRRSRGKKVRIPSNVIAKKKELEERKNDKKHQVMEKKPTKRTASFLLFLHRPRRDAHTRTTS
jgi:hypothetical protein